MLPFKHIPRLFVVKLFFRWLPMDQIEIFAIVFQVAPHAIFPIGIQHTEPRVVTVLAVEPAGNFFVAIQALKCRRARAELMATRALCCPCQ